jgi:hypothetical protein
MSLNKVQERLVAILCIMKVPGQEQEFTIYNDLIPPSCPFTNG